MPGAEFDGPRCGIPWERSTVGAHWNAIKRFLATGAVTLLHPFEGTTVAGKHLQTDPDVIEDWALQGQLDFEEIYTSVY